MPASLLKRLSFTGTAAIVLIGTGLIVVPSTGCSCEEPWMDLLSNFGLKTPESMDASNVSGKQLTAAAHRNLIGTPLSGFSFPRNMQPTRCYKRDASGFDCEFWIFSGLMRDAGVRIKISADANGLVRDAKVSDLNRWAGRWIFES